MQMPEAPCQGLIRNRAKNLRTSICLLIGEEEEETVSERISKIGFGWYQVQCFVLCCGFIVAEAAELSMASGVVRCVGAEFAVATEFGLSSLMTATFAGLAAGTLMAGFLGDRFGRRVPMLCSSAGIPCTALLTSLAPNLLSVYALRFALGSFAGLGIPVAFVILSEVTPKQLRGVSVAAMGFAWCIGEFYAAAGLLLLAPDLQSGPWRRLVLWAACPALKLLVCGLLSPVTRYDTAHWLGVQGRIDEMVGAINTMARLNGREELGIKECRNLTVKAKAATLDHTQALAELGRAPLLVCTLAQCLLCFAKDFALYGSAVLWPLAWAHVRERGHLEPAAELMATALLGVPGVFLAMGVMHMLPRRCALAGAAVLCALACRALMSLECGSPVGLVGVAVFKLSFPTWQMVTMLLPAEVFPTQIKSCGYSMVALFGRLATVVAPAIVGLSHEGFLASTATLALLASIAVYLLPETRAAELVDAAAPKEPTEPLMGPPPETEGTCYGAT